MDEIIKTLKSMLSEYVPEDPRHKALTAAIEDLENRIPWYALADSVYMDGKLTRVYYCPKCYHMLGNKQTQCKCGKMIKWSDENDYREVFKNWPVRHL